MVKKVYPAAAQRSMSAVVFRWSASAPTPARQPSWKMPQVASSITSSGLRPVRVISRIDCWAKIIPMPPPTARAARMWPGVASPIRSPQPAEVRSPNRPGRSHGSAARNAAAFAWVSGQTSNDCLPWALASPEKVPSAMLPAGAMTHSRFSSPLRARK